MHKATWGIILVSIGALFFLTEIDLVEIGGFWRFWPLILIALGTAKLFSPGRDGARGGGVWMLLVGACALLINFDVFGLRWSNAWPIFIIAAGVSIVWEALFGRRRREHQENEHVR
jgi:hypothetical protein